MSAEPRIPGGPAGAGPGTAGALAEAAGATKRFGELLAVYRVDLAVAAGQVVGPTAPARPP